MKILFPITADIITPGHIKCIEWLRDYKNQIHPMIYLGLLTDNALEKYKKPVMKFEDRKYILETIANGIRTKMGMPCVWVYHQTSLDPSNLIKLKRPVAIASGDGWEEVEEKAIKKYGLIKINIKLKGERKKKYSSSAIKKLCQKKS